MPAFLKFVLVLGLAQPAVQEGPGAPVSSLADVREYLQTLRGRLAVAEHELQIAERELAGAEDAREIDDEALRALRVAVDQNRGRRDRIATTIADLNDIARELESGRRPLPAAFRIRPLTQWLECTDALRRAGLDTASEFIVAFAPDGRIETLVRIAGGTVATEVPDSDLGAAIQSEGHALRTRALNGLVTLPAGGVEIVRQVMEGRPVIEDAGSELDGVIRSAATGFRVSVNRDTYLIIFDCDN